MLSNQSIGTINLESIEIKQKKLEIESTLLKLFKANDYKQEGYFNSDVWFLKNDIAVQALKTNSNSSFYDNSKSFEIISENKIYKILNYLSMINNSTTNSTNTNKTKTNSNHSNENINNNNRENQFLISNCFPTLKVQVKTFINTLASFLLESQRTIDNCNDHIINFKIHEKVSAITKCLKEIERKKQKLNYYEERTSISKVIFYLNKLEYLPEGEYSFILNLHEITHMGNLNFHCKKLNSKKKFKLTVSGQSINLVHVNLPFKDISYSAFELYEIKNNILQKSLKLDVNKDIKSDFIDKDIINRESIMYKNKRNSKNNNNKNNDSITINDNNSDEEVEITTKEETFSFNQTNQKLNLDAKNQNQTKDNTTDNINNYNNNNYSTKFNLTDSTGSNLTYFGIKIERNGEEFGASFENFLDCLLLNIDELLEINKNSFVTNFKTTAKIKPEIKEKLRLSIEDYDITLGMRIDLSLDLKHSILKRIYDVFVANITLKQYHEKCISDILEYFPEVVDRIRTILNPNPISNEDVCCDKCSIF